MVVCLAVAGCRSDPEATAAPTTRPAPSTSSTVPVTTSTTAAPGTTATAAPAADGTDLHPLVIDESNWTAEELDIIHGFVNAEIAAAVADSKPDENDRALEATHADPMLALRKRVYLAHRTQGRASKLPTNGVMRIKPERVEMLGPDSARLWVCESSDGDLYDKATGQVIDSRVTTTRDLAALDHVDGAWKLSERVNKGRWEGAVPCPSE